MELEKLGYIKSKDKAQWVHNGKDTKIIYDNGILIFKRNSCKRAAKMSPKDIVATLVDLGMAQWHKQ